MARLLAAVVGLLMGAAVRQRQGIRVILLIGAALTGALLVGERLELSSVTRLLQADNTGRDVIWNDTLDVIRSALWSGVGSYRLGSGLDPAGDCEWFTGAQGETRICPAWAKQLGDPWLKRIT
ncbi:hypothetical protein K7W42_20115 [Deinococcus sp. HMF7604]|uniref:hypothetical protein n=1 Tax=Deinococcus betulae TaxID=2873312 RepID=UPI001CC970FF|nr:hypothetical protein [Deinococcus betulae]MBZ9753146.1 hypothetical protein [Deinococcus betulae]